MIRVRLINEGKVVKQITSRVHEGVVLAQIEKYQDAYDTVQIVEGDLSEGAKDMLRHVAKKIIPAAMAAGVALGGANGAQAQGGANPNYPGLNYSVGDHVRDIVSPNYRERVRQREHQRSTERQVWDAEQNEIRRQRVQAARDAARTHSEQNKVYDQARNSGDGKFIIIYGMDDRVTRIPAKGTEFMPADSQRLAHYITPNGRVYYVRHPHTSGIASAISKESVTEGREGHEEFDKGYADAQRGVDKNPYNPNSPAYNQYRHGQQAFKRHIGEGYTVTRGIDRERYTERPGLEGPFATKSGKVVYYDKREGKYYDPDTDMYIEYDDWRAMNEGGTVGTVGTIPASGTGTSMTQKTKFAPTGKTTDVQVNDRGELELADPNALDTMTKQKLAKAGIKLAEAYGEESPVARAVTARILHSRLDLLQKYGPEKIIAAIDDVAEWVGDVDEIGTSDVSGWVKDVERSLGHVAEAEAPESEIERLKLRQNAEHGSASLKRQAETQARIRELEKQLQKSNVKESSHTLDSILDQYAADWAKFKAGGDIDENVDFYYALFDYWSESGEMPYGTMKGRTGDPVEWITQRMDQEAGTEQVVEVDDDDEASPADQAAADKNIIMQIRRAADYEKSTQVQLADGSTAKINSRIARELLSNFDRMRPDSKALLQQTLNTQQGFVEIVKHFGGIQDEAVTRVGKIFAQAMQESGWKL